MSGTLRISLRAGERIYINGAVFRVDRRVSLELLNSVTFLLEQHVMKPEDTTTPLRQLYFMVQTALIEPGGAPQAVEMAQASLKLLKAAFSNEQVLAGLEEVDALLVRQRLFECLKVIRGLIVIEAKILAGDNLRSETHKGIEERAVACR